MLREARSCRSTSTTRSSECMPCTWLSRVRTFTRPAFFSSSPTTCPCAAPALQACSACTRSVCFPSARACRIVRASSTAQADEIRPLLLLATTCSSISITHPRGIPISARPAFFSHLSPHHPPRRAQHQIGAACSAGTHPTGSASLCPSMFTQLTAQCGPPWSCKALQRAVHVATQDTLRAAELRFPLRRFCRLVGVHGRWAGGSEQSSQRGAHAPGCSCTAPAAPRALSSASCGRWRPRPRAGARAAAPRAPPPRTPGWPPRWARSSPAPPRPGCSANNRGSSLRRRAASGGNAHSSTETINRSSQGIV